MSRAPTDGFDRFRLVQSWRPSMTVQQKEQSSARRWVLRLVPVSIVILILGSIVAILGRAVSETTNRKDLGDGSHETLLVVEAADGQFLWMEPRDLEFGSMSFGIHDRSGRGL